MKHATPRRVAHLMLALAISAMPDRAQAAPPERLPSERLPSERLPSERPSLQGSSDAHAPASGVIETLKPALKPPSAEGGEWTEEIDMFVGESRVFSTPGVSRIAVGNGQLLSATALDGRQVIIFANGAGTSSLSLWRDDGRMQRAKIHIVSSDMGRHAREVAAFLKTVPHAQASVVGDKVIVEGDDLSDLDRDKVAELAKRYPDIVNFTSPIGWEKMVMMDVKIVEFPRTELRELGLKWNAVGGAALGGIWSPGGRGGVQGREIAIDSGDANPVPITGSVPSNLTILSALNMGLNAQLNALEQKGTASILAEPQLSTRSGFKASFLAGGEIPYSVATVNGVTIQFKPYGIKLDIEPRVGRSGVIRAIIESEVSSIDASITTTGGPALLTRRTRTEFNVRQGDTIVLSAATQYQHRCRQGAAAGRCADPGCTVSFAPFSKQGNRTGGVCHALGRRQPQPGFA
jgi:pilus assembly protein CpaC